MMTRIVDRPSAGLFELHELMALREPLAVLPTPLHRLPRLSRLVGKEVWIKRDDLTGFALGGNKVRKLEFLVADARRVGADTLVSVGAAQSNHVRTVAATAAVLGMQSHVVLGGRRPKRLTGNLMLDSLFGATLHFAGSRAWQDLAASAEDVTTALTERRRKPYLIPVGGSVPLGAASFAAAYLELREQCAAMGLSPSVVLHASSSGGTQAGLEVGRHLMGDDVRIIGVDVAKMDSLSDQVVSLARGTSELLGLDPWTCQPTVLDGYLGAGYARPSRSSAQAMRLLARTEGIVADPVYTAKALHALCDGAFDGPVVFWHTGGVPAAFA